MASRPGLSATPARRGASQVPDGSFRARCLLSPRGVRQVHLIEASPPMRASSSPADWPLPVLCNEAEPSSRDATARALAFPSFNGQDRSHPLKGRLHDFRSFIMMNTFQFTRTTKLAWRFPENTKSTKNLSVPSSLRSLRSLRLNPITHPPDVSTPRWRRLARTATRRPNTSAHPPRHRPGTIVGDIHLRHVLGAAGVMREERDQIRSLPPSGFCPDWTPFSLFISIRHNENEGMLLPH